MTRTLWRPRAACLAVLCAGFVLPPAASANAPGHVWAGDAPDYRPLARWEFGEAEATETAESDAAANADVAPAKRGVMLKANGLLGLRIEGVSGFAADRYMNRFELPATVDLVARVGLSFDTRTALAPVALAARVELDAYSGVLTAGADLEGEQMPLAQSADWALRHANLRFSVGRYLHILGGFMTSNWGLGLVANDGTPGHGKAGWAPGNASFHDPRGGDVVLRAALMTGPLTKLNLVASVAYDYVWHDDLLLEGDSATQIVAALYLGKDLPWGGGVYFAYRDQENADTGRGLSGWALDAYLKGDMDLGDGKHLKLALEAVMLQGETTLGPTPDHPTHETAQFAAAARLSYGDSLGGAVVDFLYASGDANPDDDQQNGFRADSNYQLGFLLSRVVMGAFSGRAVTTAGDPKLVGEPQADLDRLATGGRMTNMVALSPRGWIRPVDGLELYGGPVMAFTAVPLVDPLAARLAGGTPANTFGGTGGSYIGTELDVGLKYRGILFGTEWTLGAEGGVFLPGRALYGVEGAVMDAVWGGRVSLQVRL